MSDDRMIVTLSVDDLRALIRETVRLEVQAVRTEPTGMLSTQEAAELLGVHEKTIGRAVRAGELEAVHCGRGYRMSREAIEAYLRRRAVTPSGESDDVEAA